ncbi:DUF2884 family protein [Microbulbifer sp. 2205BS26-8]|uniref:DUF2884 family protein n=1 Tax=Microbulbifer sp. 2205BS26-8 TaxID=3064386 RepID=UPI00273D63A7|nr:DUF2884 family protein [Microbulbifer sp. 2205BS26-8]MDP5210418.1 DUF2884 family protein [Microbulbifer sp. 2205BS26-8]
MWKPLGISVLIGLGGATQAVGHDASSITGDNCNVSLHYSVRVGTDFLEVQNTDSGDQLVHFRPPTRLLVDGTPIPLNQQQQQLLQNYRQKLHRAGRETLLITLEAMDIAMAGLSMAITALAGPDHPDNLELQRLSKELLQRTEERLNREGEIYQLGDSEIGDFIDKTISEEFEPRIEQLARESATTIAWHALKAVFTAGQNLEQQVTEEAEQMLEQRSNQIEQHAERLCASLSSLDRLEQQVHQSIPALTSYDLVRVE